MAVHICLYLPVFDCVCLPVFACICLYLPAAASCPRVHCAAAARQLWHVRCAFANLSQRGQSIHRQIANFIRTGQRHYSCSLAATGAFLVRVEVPWLCSLPVVYEVVTTPSLRRSNDNDKKLNNSIESTPTAEKAKNITW